jgi:hypothetical protein
MFRMTIVRDASNEEVAIGEGELFDAHFEVVDYERSPLDVLRLLLFALGTLVVALLNKYLRDGWQGIEKDLTELLQVPWSWAEAQEAFPILGKAVSGLRDVLTNPSKFALLLGGSVLVTLVYVIAFDFSSHAFGIDLRFASIAAPCT